MMMMVILLNMSEMALLVTRLEGLEMKKVLEALYLTNIDALAILKVVLLG